MPTKDNTVHRQEIKDPHFKVTGYIEKMPDGRSKALDDRFNILGYYDPRKDVTLDAQFKIIGRGNILNGLLLVKKMATGKNTKVSVYWDKAKLQAKKDGLKDNTPKFYLHVIELVKKMISGEYKIAASTSENALNRLRKYIELTNVRQ
jgi:hypothetical protein